MQTTKKKKKAWDKIAAFPGTRRIPQQTEPARQNDHGVFSKQRASRWVKWNDIFSQKSNDVVVTDGIQ
jgi:hypothetical protein